MPGIHENGACIGLLLGEKRGSGDEVPCRFPGYRELSLRVSPLSTSPVSRAPGAVACGDDPADVHHRASDGSSACPVHRSPGPAGGVVTRRDGKGLHAVVPPERGRTLQGRISGIHDLPKLLFFCIIGSTGMHGSWEIKATSFYPRTICDMIIFEHNKYGNNFYFVQMIIFSFNN